MTAPTRVALLEEQAAIRAWQHRFEAFDDAEVAARGRQITEQLEETR